MKAKHFFTISLLVVVQLATAQNLAWKSNDIHLNFSQPAVASALPLIQWGKPQLEYTSSEDGKVAVQISITSETNLKNVTMRLGDNTTGETRVEKRFDDATGKTFSIERNLTLLEGTNFLELTAENENGGKVSEKRIVMVGKDALNFLAADRKDIALIFATDTYDHWDDLVNPVSDGQTIAKELKEKYGFEVELVSNATVEEVFEKIRDYNERKFKPQDQLMIFFAGHGVFDDTFGEGYVVAKNSLANDKAKTTYIPHSRLRTIINNIPSQHTFLMMDVCFGGTFDPVIARSRALAAEVSERELLVRKFSYKTRKYLTSGGKAYVSDGIAGQHSPFAAKFIDALRSNGGSDRVLTLAELQVSMEKLSQIPRFGTFGDDETLSDFVFVAKQ